ncbi:MAG TPA: hypothetical protein VIM10_09775 [Actinopolymorphaceae bacterium]|jgi:hypothetical protein
MTARRFALVLAATLAATTVSMGSAPAFAKGGDDVRSSHACSTGVINLKAKHDDGVVVCRGQRTTVAPSGLFSVEKRITDRSGPDTITVRATRGSSVCSTGVSLPTKGRT